MNVIVHACMHVCVCVSMFKCMCTCLCVCVRVHSFVCVCGCVCQYNTYKIQKLCVLVTIQNKQWDRAGQNFFMLVFFKNMRV